MQDCGDHGSLQAWFWDGDSQDDSVLGFCEHLQEDGREILRL